MATDNTRTVVIQYTVELPIMPTKSIIDWANQNTVFMEAEQGMTGIKPNVQKIQVLNIT